MDTIKKVANAILDAGEGCQYGLVYVDPVEAAKAAIAALSTEECSYNAGFNDGWEAANGEPPEAALSTDAEPVANMHPTKCKNCGGFKNSWFATNRVNSTALDGRLKSNEISCDFVLGCDECSETLRVVSADDIAEALSAQVQDVKGWQEVPPETIIKEAIKGRQILAYEDGRYYNAWLEFEASEGGWLWYDDADSDPNPSHWMPLPTPPAAKLEEKP